MSGTSVFMIVLFVCSVAGLCILIISAVSVTSRPEAKKEPFGRTVADAAAEASETALLEAHRAMEELDRQAKAIFEELSAKHQELLFLYNMIDSKAAEPEYNQAGTNLAEGFANEVSRRRTFKNPNLAKILEMADKGMSVADIARELNMGQGEVRMIMNLGKL